jgi:hypothetical protein
MKLHKIQVQFRPFIDPLTAGAAEREQLAVAFLIGRVLSNVGVEKVVHLFERDGAARSRRRVASNFNFIRKELSID